LQLGKGKHIVLRRKNVRKGKMNGALLPAQKMQEKKEKNRFSLRTCRPPTGHLPPSTISNRAEIESVNTRQF